MTSDEGTLDASNTDVSDAEISDSDETRPVDAGSSPDVDRVKRVSSAVAVTVPGTLDVDSSRPTSLPS